MVKPMLLTAIVLAAMSGLPGVVANRRSLWGQWLATALLVIGNTCGLFALWRVFAATGPVEILRLVTPIPGADFVLAADPIAVFFLAPIMLVTMLGSIYGLEYWRQSEHQGDGQKLRLYYGFLTAALIVLVLGGNSVTFLIGWEIMAVSAFFLVGTQDEQDEVCVASWLYLAASHTATICLFVMFALMYQVTGSYDLVPLAKESLSPGMGNAIFVLALLGFGLKAGLMPVHFWLPSAHAMAPSHVSAVMSGVLIKSGIYGLVRMTSLLPNPPLWWGELLLILGALSAVLGLVFALGQHDMKRLLAYSSIENIGVIVIGLGLAMIGRTLDQPIWIALGLSGCLLHVWNHALFKSLLFLCAGSVLHARQTREIDRLGGLAKSMPWTSACFLLGATAVCGLPPLNGFVSEYLIYMGLFQTLGLTEGAREFPLAAFIVPVLALMGGLAVACFVKVFGVIFLGVSRVSYEHPAHECGWLMRGPMCLLGLCCVCIGLGAPVMAPALDLVISIWTQSDSGANRPAALVQLVPLKNLSLVAISLVVLLSAGLFALQTRINSQPLGWTETWGCGYTGPTPRMQYTSSSLAQFLVELFSGPLQPIFDRPHVDRLFPRSAKFSSYIPEFVLDRAVMPAVHGVARVLFWFRLLQQGSVQIYLLYIFAILVVLLMFGK